MSAKQSNKVSKNSGSVWEKLGPIFLVVLVGVAFLTGSLWQKVKLLEGGKSNSLGTQNAGNAAGVGDQQAAAPTDGKLTADQIANIPEVTSEDHIRGSLDAQVYLIEYSDLECPFCSRFHETAQQAVEEYDGQVAWVYRHFPLESLHPNARDAAYASECAAEFGGEDAFWQYVDKIFDGSPGSLTRLDEIAGEMGLDQTSFRDCIDSERYQDLVDSDYDGGAQAGVTGTPGNFIMNQNGDAWLIPGAVPFESLKISIDEALAG